ncbi:polysaccharide deacetylase family protein [Paenibacillus athensensis]|uniref:Xylanase deacetylase n=1 Tax=Paenibacillus athensensis TaxID=1967502 RepID=A0A4Y8Q9B3_9BACL|nr:polysaccharide deacetylase family protein [Paenibacillus athensensis]MCD1259002.1 polysaccharide deacetylase family protein [Paenibacillus athensensis]
MDRRRSLTAPLLLVMLSATLAGCAGQGPTAASGSSGAATATPPTPTATVVPTPVPTATPTPEPTATPTATPSPTPTVKPTVKPAAKGELAPLSWYYMKKKTGQVPDFPRDTKSFTPDMKAVWVGTGKKVYLTIDAGGPLIDVDLMLKSLKDNDVKANFFISGNNIKNNPDYLKRLVADGHLIANHTMTHKDFNELTDEQILQEISGFEQLYKQITGQEVVKFFRFPYGHYNMHNLQLVSSLGYTSVFWSTAMRDWEPRKNGADDPYNDIMNNLHDGNVILMHQGSKENMEALDRILKDVKAKGYEFGLVSELQG